MQLANPAFGGGASSESLIEAQVFALGRYPVEVAIAKGIRRDTRWRPLNEVERELAVRERVEKYWRNKGVVDAVECYWLVGPSEPTAG